MIKNILKKIVLALIVLLALFQFYPRAKKNNIASENNDISKIHAVPADVQTILKTSCYDCHSNNTYYPWYSNIQPVSLWLNDHIEDGKKELNFSEFATYSLRRQFKKLEEINGEVKEDKMPLQSYTIIHRDAALSKDQKLLLATWVTNLRDSMQKNYPADSLKRKPRPATAP